MFRVLEGRDMVLVCQAAGIPAPNLTWSLAGRRLDSEDGRLELTDVGRNQEGNYLCTAKNKYGETQREVPLQVNRGDTSVGSDSHTLTMLRRSLEDYAKKTRILFLMSSKISRKLFLFRATSKLTRGWRRRLTSYG